MADSIPYRIPRIGHFPFGAASALKLLRLVSALHLIAGAAKSQAQDSGPLQTFTAPDGTFSFRYPSLLIHCQQKAQGYSWTPAETCAAYHPVCDEEASPSVGAGGGTGAIGGSMATVADEADAGAARPIAGGSGSCP